MNITRSPKFIQKTNKLDSFLKIKLKKQIQKIINNPQIGKPMKYDRKGTRELYLPPFRISYEYFLKEEHLNLLNIYHKKHQ
jgi:mRNA-degrading endonuclease RelE of RelBE toxin-antitoxin system